MFVNLSYKFKDNELDIINEAYTIIIKLNRYPFFEEIDSDCLIPFIESIEVNYLDKEGNNYQKFFKSILDFIESNKHHFNNVTYLAIYWNLDNEVRKGRLTSNNIIIVDDAWNLYKTELDVEFNWKKD